jgi:hypothetical protein
MRYGAEKTMRTGLILVSLGTRGGAAGLIIWVRIEYPTNFYKQNTAVVAQVQKRQRPSFKACYR